MCDSHPRDGTALRQVSLRVVVAPKGEERPLTDAEDELLSPVDRTVFTNATPTLFGCFPMSTVLPCSQQVRFAVLRLPASVTSTEVAISK